MRPQMGLSTAYSCSTVVICTPLLSALQREPDPVIVGVLFLGALTVCVAKCGILLRNLRLRTWLR